LHDADNIKNLEIDCLILITFSIIICKDVINHVVSDEIKDFFK